MKHSYMIWSLRRGSLLTTEAQSDAEGLETETVNLIK